MIVMIFNLILSRIVNNIPLYNFSIDDKMQQVLDEIHSAIGKLPKIAAITEMATYQPYFLKYAETHTMMKDIYSYVQVQSHPK